jgi:putative thioredoxin
VRLKGLIMDNSFVIEVSDDTFQKEVIERSKETTVVVDFWAEWCGPCRQLGPVLEKEVESRGGAVILAKIDTDQNSKIAMQFRVSGIPAVKAFRDGKVVADFVGARPPAEIKRFFDKLVPSPAEQSVSRGKELLQKGQEEAAEALFQEALSLDVRCEPARVELICLWLKQGKQAEATAIAEKIARGSSERALADALLWEASLEADATKEDPRAMLDAIDAEPNNLALRWSVAARFFLNEEHEDALREFLEIVKRDRNYRDDGARKAILSIFAMLGPEHELVTLFRRRLSQALY